MDKMVYLEIVVTVRAEKYNYKSGEGKSGLEVDVPLDALTEIDLSGVVAGLVPIAAMNLKAKLAEIEEGTEEE